MSISPRCRFVHNTALTVMLGTLFVAGCGQSGPYPIVSVSGTVTYDDGSTIPSDRILIRFDSLEEPIDAKTHPRPGIAVAGADGSFSLVTTKKYGDGIVRGKHKVTIAAADAEGNQLIPKEYSESTTTPLEVDSADHPFNFKVPRP